MLTEVSFVTSNRKKAEEVREIFSKFRIPLKVVYGETVEIQSEDLTEIALYRAVHAYRSYKNPVFVEDAGLFIKSLNGFPGPFSSYVYRTLGISNVLEMVDPKNRQAYFQSVVCYYAGGSTLRIFSGRCYGTIAERPSGTNGFGFDPIFIPKGMDKTFAEISLKEKNKISHRGVAVRKLCRWLYKVRYRQG